MTKSLIMSFLFRIFEICLVFLQNKEGYMRAIIPVAGIGSRLRPHTFTVPKVLLNVGGKPVLGHILDDLTEQGITDCTIVVGYRGDLVEEYVTNNFSLNCTFVTQEERKGLGHSIWIAKETIRDDEPLLIILGDTVFDLDMKSFCSNEHSALGVKYVDDPRRFGVAVTDIQGSITKLVEKPDTPISHLALVGMYFIKNPRLLKQCLDTLIADDIRTRGEYQLTDALQLMMDAGERFVPHTIEGWYDCGKPETLLSTNRHILSKKPKSRPIGDSIIIPPVYIADTAVIERSIIGPYATIAANAHVVESIVQDSIVSFGAQVKQSLLKESIIGNNALIAGRFRKLNAGDSTEIDFAQ